MSSSTTSTSSSVPSFYTMDGTTRFNGSEFASGLDTQNLIKALTAKTSEKITKQQQLQQKVQWKQEMYHAVEDLLQNFSDTYLSYSTNSSTNLMSRAFFDTEQLISSDSGIVTATGDASDAGNVEINKISQLATSAVWNGSDVSVPDVHTAEALGNTVSSSSYLDVNVGGMSYTVTLGSSVDLTYNDDGTISDTSLQNLAKNLNSQVQQAGLAGKLTFTADGGSITMTAADEATKITGGSQNFISGLGMTEHKDDSGSVTSYTLDGTVQKSIASLGSQLAGTSMTVQLDGLTKTISFNQSEVTQYSDADSLKSYLQGKFDSAFGSGKVTVGNNSGMLSFSVADSSSVLTFASASDTGLLGKSGLLHIRSGETNRLELDKTLDELAGELKTSLITTAVDDEGKPGYSFTVNGKEFTFSGNTELNTVINTVNNDTTANVTISYSQTLNRFRIVSDDTGSQGSISIYDNAGGGNLAAALFGNNTALNSGTVAEADYKDSGKTSAYNVFLNGSSTPVSFTVSGDTANLSIADFAKSVQTSIDGTALNGKLKAEVSSDGKSLVFNSTDGSSITMAAADATSDLLGIGSAGKTTSSFMSGQDLKMNVTLGGTATDITRGTNSFTLDGITMSVNGTTDGKVTFSAADNTDDLYKKISAFVDTYNTIISAVNTDVTQMPASQSTSNGGGKTYAPLTDDQKKEMTDKEIDEWQTKAKQGLLFGDPQLSELQNNLRSAMESVVSSTGLSLADIGISTQAYDYTSGGKLVIDETKLKNALKNDSRRVEQLFTNSDGVASRLNDVITKNIGVFGNSGTLVDVAGSSTLIGVDNSQFANEIKQFQDNIKALQTTLTSEQNRLQAKFTQMESIISKLSTQFDYISNMGASGS